MRKTIFILTSLLTCLGALADTKSDELLRALQSRVEALGDYRATFKVTVDGQSMDGTYQVSANSYHIATPDVEVFCDGQTRWEVNMLDEEVLIDTIDPADRTILGNPTRMFDFLDGSYTHTYVGRATLKNGEAARIELTGNAGAEQDKLTVYLNVASHLPARIVYRLSNLNTDAVVEIESITAVKTPDQRAFVFEQSRYEGFEIIDFR
jgi:outer membrane lipoprotein-sorting protein